MLHCFFYGSGFFAGEEYKEMITITSLVIKNQSIGVLIDFDGVDCVLGLAPDDLTEGTLSTGGEIPTAVDYAFAQGSISAKVLGVAFEPTTQEPATNGELTFGGVGYKKVTGPIECVSFMAEAG